jgi:ABC-type transport system involved in cytochrome c biogenesis ATPase subunit
MILRRIQVEGFQCFAARFAIGPFTDGINVISGPNGSGKSTLVRAFLRALLDPHRGGGRSAEILRPRGRMLAPAVEVEFEHAGARYRIFKRFLDRPAALLERYEGDGWLPVAESDAATARVREMLRAEGKDRGIGAALWSPQGGLALEPLTGDALADIQRSLGAQLLPPEGRALESRVYLRYREFFTSTGKLRGGRDAPRAVLLEAEHREAARAVGLARAEMDEIGQIAQQLTAAREQASATIRRRDTLAAQCAALSGHAARHAELDGGRQKLELERKAAESEYRRLAERADRLARVSAKAADLRQKAESARAAIEEQKTRIKERQEAKQLATEALWRVMREDPGARWRASFTAAEAQSFRVLRGQPAGEHRLVANETIEITSDNSDPSGLEFLAGGPGRVRVHEDQDAARREQRLRLAQDRLAAAGMEASQAETRAGWLVREAGSLTGQLAAVDADLAQLDPAGGSPAEEREQAALRFHGVDAALHKLRAELAALPYDPAAAAKIEREMRDAGEAARSLEGRILELQAVLRRLIGSGPYGRLSEAEERLHAIDEELAREKLRAEAVRLLWETVSECKAEALEGLHEPVARAASRLLERITGRPAAGLRLTQDFVPAAVEDFAIEELSGGEAEQVYLATRLALAGYLSRGTRQLVVLDDVLTATDPDRLARVADLLREQSAFLQFLILTCHPERYKGLGTHWSLDAREVAAKQ